LSLLERGEAPWQASAVDPEAALDSAIRACSGLAADRNVRIVSGPRARGVRVEANADRLAQVFINLISNAIKYNTSENPLLRITTRIAGDDYEMLFADNGPGIPHDEREKVFSKFMRGSASTRGPAAGAGLGLAISWQIMRRFGGALTLLPEGPGACFRVALARMK
jgi:signal transduction histidine kinase